MGQVKEPAVAGMFYPGDEAELRGMVDGFLKAVPAPPQLDGRLAVLVAPHAGYIYSGQVAAYSYARLKGAAYRSIVLIGPSHRAPVNGVAVFHAGGLRTPLGIVKVDESLARSFIDADNDVMANSQAFAQEHSLEVQLPFLQRVLPDVPVVPLLVGNPTQRSFESVSAKLAALLKDRTDVLVVVSTDLSHYHSSRVAEPKDRAIIAAVERCDAGGLIQLMQGGKGEACGGYPLLYAMAAARQLGSAKGVLFKYADSGDASGDKQKVVGYAAMGISVTPRSELKLQSASFLKPDERDSLLKLAKDTVHAHVSGAKLPDIASPSGVLAEKGAAFVTLKRKNGSLRGCIGHIVAREPLYKSVIDNAIAASSKDPRFRPVKPDELPGLDIEVTVLSPIEPLADVKDIRLGYHGLLLDAGYTSSVFLPQVPVEQGWDLDTYLAELAMKAGMSADGWKKAKLFTFTAEIIH